MATLRTLAAAALLLLASAGARMAGAGEIMHTPAEIRACLCLDQAVTAASAALYEETVNFEAERKALAEIEARADEGRRNWRLGLRLRSEHALTPPVSRA